MRWRLGADAGAPERKDPPASGSQLTQGGSLARAPRWWAPALYLILLVAFAAGIWGSYRSLFPARDLYRVSGVFVARAGDQMILVRHEAVPDLMDDMQSMLFFTESRELIDRAGLTPGDRVRFTVRKTPERLLVVEILKIK